jgi:hypothetical protein
MLNELREANRQLGASLSEKLAGVKQDLLYGLQQLSDELRRQHDENTLRMQQEEAQKTLRKQTRKLADTHIDLGLIKTDKQSYPEQKEDKNRKKLSISNEFQIGKPVDVQHIVKKISENADSANNGMSQGAQLEG